MMSMTPLGWCVNQEERKAAMATTPQITEKLSVTPFLAMQDVTFAKSYSDGVRWSLFGEQARRGLVDDRYIVNSFTRDVVHGWFDGQHEQAVSQSPGFCLGMIHGGMVLPDGRQRPEIATLVRMQNQDFASGYHIGRDWFFNESEPHERMKTDRDFIERLQGFVEDQESLHPRYFHMGETDLIYWYIGCLLGELSGYIFPQQEEEVSYRTIMIVTTSNMIVA